MEDIILSMYFKECIVCGELTDRIDICTEQRICSNECQNIIDREHEEYMSRIEGDGECL